MNVVSLSLKLSYCTPLTFLHVMMWDKTPTWWDEVKRMMETLCHSTRLLPAFWTTYQKEAHLLPDDSWLRVTETVKTETTDKAGTTVGTPGWLSWLSTQLSISAQVMISQFASSSPASGSLCCRCRACFRCSVPLALCPSPTCTVSLKYK